jgi:kojibiose phosphorylase
MDINDLRGNTGDGIHAASAGAVWQAVVMGFGGLRITDDGPIASPCLPPGWERLKFRIQHHGKWYEFDLTPDTAHESRFTQHESRNTNHAPTIRGVIFDLDGVLTDTSELHYQGWQRMADEAGIPFDREANEALRGISRRDSLNIILGDRPASEEQIQEMMARKNRYYADALKTVTRDNLLPGALDLLEELRELDIRVAVGSASRNARTVIERLGIGSRVDAVSDGYSVERQKPAPDLFLHAAAQLGLPPAQCLVVEDAASGVEAGLAAGSWTVGLGPPERVGAAHVVLPNLDGVRWANVLARLNMITEEDG